MSSGSVIVEPSYAVIEELVFGRFSFNGFNPQIEVYFRPIAFEFGYVLPRKYNCSLFDRFCTILTDISLINNTSDYFGF